MGLRRLKLRGSWVFGLVSAAPLLTFGLWRISCLWLSLEGLGATIVEFGFQMWGPSFLEAFLDYLPTFGFRVKFGFTAAYCKLSWSLRNSAHEFSS